MEAGLRPGAKATEWPPDPKAGAPPADPTFWEPTVAQGGLDQVLPAHFSPFSGPF